MPTLAGNFCSFIKNRCWDRQEDGKLFIETEITPGGTGSINVRDG